MKAEPYNPHRWRAMLNIFIKLTVGITLAIVALIVALVLFKLVIFAAILAAIVLGGLFLFNFFRRASAGNSLSPR
jgi:small-conductance mechanosensitive channel